MVDRLGEQWSFRRLTTFVTRIFGPTIFSPTNFNLFQLRATTVSVFGLHFGSLYSWGGIKVTVYEINSYLRYVAVGLILEETLWDSWREFYEI